MRCVSIRQSSALLFCVIAVLCVTPQVSSWKRTTGEDRWWETVFRDLESSHGAEVYVAGPVALHSPPDDAPLLIKMIFMTSCKCESQLGGSNAPEGGGSSGESVAGVRPTAVSTGGFAVNNAPQNQAPQLNNQNYGNEPALRAPAGATDSDTILPPRYTPKQTEQTTNVAGRTVPVLGDAEVRNNAASSRRNTKKGQRTLGVYFDGIPTTSR